tara:strand:+ start:83 stop:880 length:798 start_codon:yes stop_codon:yes gene_type:complete
MNKQELDNFQLIPEYYMMIRNLTEYVDFPKGRSDSLDNNVVRQPFLRKVFENQITIPTVVTADINSNAAISNSPLGPVFKLSTDIGNDFYKTMLLQLDKDGNIKNSVYCSVRFGENNKNLDGLFIAYDHETDMVWLQCHKLPITSPTPFIDIIKLYMKTYDGGVFYLKTQKKKHNDGVRIVEGQFLYGIDYNKVRDSMKKGKIIISITFTKNEIENRYTCGNTRFKTTKGIFTHIFKDKEYIDGRNSIENYYDPRSDTSVGVNRF